MDSVSKIKERESRSYPSADLVRLVCAEDYLRVIDTYNKMYDRTGIVLGLFATVFIFIVSNFDYKKLLQLAEAKECFTFISLLLCFLFSFGLMVYSICQLLSIMRSRAQLAIDSELIKNNRIHEYEKEEVSAWMIEQYTKSASSIKRAIEEKNAIFNRSITCTMFSIALYTIGFIVQKVV